MSLVPAKRPGRGGGRDSDYEDCEDDGLCVGYAEEVDERRAELLRRLEFKTSGPASLVNPWASRPQAHTPGSVGGGKLVASFALSQEAADPWDADPHAATRAEDAQAYRAMRLALQGQGHGDAWAAGPGKGTEARPGGSAAAAAAAAVAAAVAQVAQLVEERPLHYGEEGEGGPAAVHDPAALQSQGQGVGQEPEQEQEQEQQAEGRLPLSPLAAWQSPCQGGAAQHGQQQAQGSPGVHAHPQPRGADGKHAAGGAGCPRVGLPLAVTLSGPGFGFDAGGAGRRDGQHGGVGRHGAVGQGGAKKAKFAIRDPVAPGAAGARALAGDVGVADPAGPGATQGTQAGGAREGGRGRGPSSLAALLGGGPTVPAGPQASSRTPGPGATPVPVPLVPGSAPRHQPHAAATGSAAAAGSPRNRHDPAWQTPHAARTRGASGRSRGHAASTPAHTPLPAAVSFTPLVSVAAPTPSSSGRRPPVTLNAASGAATGGGGGTSLRDLLRSDRTPPPSNAAMQAGGDSGACGSGRAGPSAPGTAAARGNRGAGRGATAAVPWSRTPGPAPGAGGGGGGENGAGDVPGSWLGHGQGHGHGTRTGERQGTGQGHGTAALGCGQHPGPAGFLHQQPHQPADLSTPGRVGEGSPPRGAGAGGVGEGGGVAVGDTDYGQQQQQHHVQREEGQQHARPSARELMQQQSHRQQAFLAGLAAPGHAANAGAAAGAGGAGGGGVASTPQSLATLLTGGGGGGGSLAIAGRRGGAGKAAAGLVGRLQAVLAGLKAAADREASAAASAAPPPPPPGSLLVEVRAKAREAHLVSTTCTVRQVYGSEPCNGQPPASQRQQSQQQQQQQQPAASQLPSQRARGLAAGGSAFAASTPQPRVCVGQVVHVLLDSKKAARGPGCAGELDPGSSFLVLPPYKVLHVTGERGSQSAGEAWSVAGVGAGGSGGGAGTGAGSGGGATVVVMAHVVRAGP